MSHPSNNNGGKVLQDLFKDNNNGGKVFQDLFKKSDIPTMTLEELEQKIPDLLIVYGSDTLTISEYKALVIAQQNTETKEDSFATTFITVIFVISLLFIAYKLIKALSEIASTYETSQKNESSTNLVKQEEKKEVVAKEKNIPVSSEKASQNLQAERSSSKEDLSGKSKAIDILKELGCEVKILGPVRTIDPDKYTPVYENEANQKIKEGFASVLVLLDDLFVDNFLCEYEEHQGKDLMPYLKSKLESPLLDAEEILNQRMDDIKDNYDDVDWDTEFVKRKLSSPERINTTFTKDETSDTLALINVPVGDASKICDVFCYLPVGGDASPESLEHRSIANYWMEKYGVVPAFISGGVVQYRVFNIPDNDIFVRQLAMEQFAYSEDIITQSSMGIEDLEDFIKCSRYWFFWWD